MLATRYDEIFEVATDFTSPPIVTAAMESCKGTKRYAPMEAKLLSRRENEVFEEVDRAAEKKTIGTK